MKLNVVVVDDETPICEWLTYCMKHTDEVYEVVSATDGESALALIQEKKPDLVFTDICMPGMNGLELMKNVLLTLPFTVFVILTNYAEFSYAKEAVSLGAKEYLLKAELRASDIQKLLKNAYESKKKILESKEKEILPNGDVDLYNFYKNAEEAEHADRFWKQQGMKKDIHFQIICYQESESGRYCGLRSQTWECLDKEGGRVVYWAIAKGKNHKYIILQCSSGISEITGKLTRSLTGYGSFGVSSVITKRSEVLKGLHESDQAWNLSFFREEDSIIYYEQIKKRPVLDQKKMYEEKKEIISEIFHHKYNEAEERLQKCCDQLEKTDPENSAWGIEFTKRLVQTIEETYCQEFDGEVPKAVKMDSAGQCRRSCMELIKRMKEEYHGKYSISIADALEYIHRHYAENISMAEVARCVYKSPEYFSRRFKQEVGVNFNSYVTLYRLDCGQKMLRHTNMTVSEISARIGFSTPGYFTQLYKRYKGITPEQERRSKM